MRVDINHVALSARDLQRSTAFYEALFGCEQLPVPDVGFPTVWLSLGDRQLHLFQRDTQIVHVGFRELKAVGSRFYLNGKETFLKGVARHEMWGEDQGFAEACRRAEGLGAFEGAPYGREAYRLPDGTLQLFLRDPDGHLIEIDGVPGSPEEAGGVSIVPLSQLRLQDGEHARATLFHTGIPFTNGAGPA